MKRDKYVRMDVHQSMTVVAAMNAEGKIVLETMVPTATSRIRELIESLGGPLHVTKSHNAVQAVKNKTARRPT